MVNMTTGEGYVMQKAQADGYTILYFQEYALIVTSSMANLHRKSDQNSMVMARIEQNYIADLRKCIEDWCEIHAGKYDGWIKKTDIWGDAPDEIR